MGRFGVHNVLMVGIVALLPCYLLMLPHRSGAGSVDGPAALAVVKAAIMPGTELSMLRPGLVGILAFGVLTLPARFTRKRA